MLFAAADFLGVEQLKLMTVRRPRHTPEAQIPVLTVPIAPPEPPHGVCAVQVAKIEAELSTANVCHTLTVADNHSASQLKETCIAFIVMHFKEVHHQHEYTHEHTHEHEHEHTHISIRISICIHTRTSISIRMMCHHTE